jgi:long-subunit fatty acid transport protein
MALFVSAGLFGQGEIDAYRFSKNELSGTARGQAMGGAFGALGGDATGIAINPAGIGVYSSSEIVFNTGLTYNQTQADFNGTKELSGNTKLSCDNFAYVGYFPLGNDDLNSLNFGFNYNRLKNFDRKYSVSGKGMGSSLTDYMREITFGTQWNFWGSSYDDQFFASGHPHWLGVLGWNGYLISEDTKSESEDEYVSILEEGEKVNPRLKVREKGSINAYDFTLGINLDNNVYLGATVAFTNISYTVNTSYGEEFDNDGIFKLENDYKTDGSGLQVKLGAIFRPTDALRLGISYHSPTMYNLTDFYRGTLSPKDIDEDEKPVSTPDYDNYHKYKFQTPDVWTLSAAVVLGRSSIISLDYEYKNYGAMNFSEQYLNGYDFEAENQYINEDFKGASTIRVGAETRFTPQFSGRLGFAWMQNPYNSKVKNGEIEVITPGTIPNYTIDGDALYLTTGIGFRFTPHFYMDLAIVYREQEDKLHFFSPTFDDDGNPLVVSTPSNLTNSSIKTQLTLGYKF